MKTLLTVFAAVSALTLTARADNPAGKELMQDAQKVAKKTTNKVKDATCEMFNSKGECIAKKAGHKIENAVEEVKDKAND